MGNVLYIALWRNFYVPASILARTKRKSFNGPIKTNTTAIKMPRPRNGLCSIRVRQFSYPAVIERGSIPESTFEPSSGGIGIRFKNPSQRFTMTPIKQIATMIGSPIARASAANINARAKFVSGPAPATITSPQRGARIRLYGLYGTGIRPEREWR
jgi:hypothetical protein